MTSESSAGLDHPAIKELLQPGEMVTNAASAGDAFLAVTTHRLAVIHEDRAALDVPIHNLRRIEFDIEKSRPATLVIVPENPNDLPQVLPVRPDEYDGVAAALVTIGHRLAEWTGPDGSTS